MAATRNQLTIVRIMLIHTRCATIQGKARQRRPTIYRQRSVRDQYADERAKTSRV
jgi:hypothetical protein